MPGLGRSGVIYPRPVDERANPANGPKYQGFFGCRLVDIRAGGGAVIDAPKDRRRRAPGAPSPAGGAVD
jgi:hypothetical protein